MSEPAGVTWTEEQWTAKLAPFAKAPPTDEEKLTETLTRKVSESRAIADEIMEEFKKSNLQYFLESGVSNDTAIMMSLHVHHRLRAVSIEVGGVPFTVDVLNFIISGDLEVAYTTLSYMTADDMSLPYHFLSQSRIDTLKAMIATRVPM